MEIYKITNLINNKCYIGQTINNFVRRYDSPNWWKSKRMNRYLKSAIKKYGQENFKVEILEKDILSEEVLSEREIFYIEENNCLHPLGYNLMSGGQRQRCRVHSMESREKMSRSNRRRHFQEFYIFRNHETNEIVKFTNLARFCEENNLLNSEMTAVLSKRSRRHGVWSLPDQKLLKWKVLSPTGKTYILLEGKITAFCRERGFDAGALKVAKKNKWNGPFGWTLLEVYED